ncbi:uncharacterized protein PRCAT00001034001 [Priceomyces carsonii]|uniref:uncharacterized protein n=1 Tax=Priceomyces carsonii TaxID=28549 RepID=UPI002ED9CEBA|nr:unnamed protein product [Priceomyces carsonii]
MMLIRFLAVYFMAIVFGAQVNAKTHTWYFKTTWVDANPDGTLERKVIGFNNSWPLPTLRVQAGDRVNLYLINGFEDRNTTLHFHGLFQNGTGQMDGPEMITQCPIPPGETFLYNFTVGDQVGTYWYHSHTKGQYQDGMRAPFIIEEKKKSDYPFDFDEELVLPIGEWYHDHSDKLFPTFLSLYNPTGAEPIPQNTLFNDTRNNSMYVEPDKTYFVRIVNVGGFVSQYLYMEDHEFEVVEVDGIYVKPNKTSMIYITVAQRYGVLIKTKSDTSKNYAFMNKIDDTMLDVIPDDLILNSTNYIVYDESNDKPDEYTVDALDYLDDFFLEPVEKVELYDDADQTITVDVIMDNLDNGINYAFFNNITYTAPKVPVLLTALSAGKEATNSLVYGTNTHSFVLQGDETIDIVVNNQDTGKHPFHLHGHVFQVIERHEEVPDTESPVGFNKSDHAEWPEYPVRRDTVYVQPQSYMVLRFKADNPGVWFFHCHIEWHLEQGLALVLVEDPIAIQENSEQQLTESSKNACKKNGISIEGNAAGNSKDYLDLTGQNVQVKALPAGFTARGIVALVFSCIAAVLGLVAIAIYGLADIKDVEARVARDLDVEDVINNEDDTNEDIHEESEILPSSSGKQ